MGGMREDTPVQLVSGFQAWGPSLEIENFSS